MTNLPEEASLSIPTGMSTRERSSSSSTMNESICSSVSSVHTKRQNEFERYFTDRFSGDFEVVHTQSADLQAKLLLHGRLYLTRSHLCFRSNILGYLTESIHPLRDITSVEKGTTAKWIQNAIYISVQGPDGIQDVAYGSLGDREAMFDVLVECWKVVAPERFEEWSQEGKEAAQDGEEEVVHHTNCSGDHFQEVAIDTKLSILPKELFELLYRNDQFMTDFYRTEKKLTDLNISDWEIKGGLEERTLSYTMHMNNPIGPSSSDCIGTEVILHSNPEEAYEIVSETQTPGVPSGDKFKIRTRTCLTHTEINGTPSTRMLCTTQCDWSSSSWLKGTITPAVIKGQKEHHHQLVQNVRQYIKEQPEFKSVEQEETKDGMKVVAEEATPTKTVVEHAQNIPENPVMLGIVAFLCVVIFYQWVSGDT